MKDLKKFGKSLNELGATGERDVCTHGCEKSFEVVTFRCYSEWPKTQNSIKTLDFKY